MANDHVKMFTEEYAPIAEQVSKQTGIAPSLLLAQWGMESKYGRSPAGQFNFGNIKDLSGTGKEAIDNKTKSKDKYLNFESPEAFGDYYANLMRRLYPKALNTGADITKYTEGLRNGVKGSYFEDPDYEDAVRGAYKVTSNFYSDVGDEKTEKPTSPFAGLKEEFAETNRQVQEAQKASEDEKKKEPTTLLERASSVANEIEPETGAIIGAGVNVVGPMLAKPILTPQEEALKSAQDKLELARKGLNKAAPQGFEDLQKSYLESQSELERIKNEQKLKEMQLSAIPPASPPPAPIPQEQFEVESRKIAGAGSPYNTVQAVANQRVPYNLAIQAIDTTHNQGHGKGSYDIVDIFNQGVARAAPLGGSEYVLTGEKGPGELYLKRELADPINAEIQKRTETTQNQQAILAQQQEQERLRLQAELDRIREERASRGSQLNALAGQVRDVKPLSKSLATAEEKAELARRKLGRSPEPTTPAGRATANVAKTVGRGALGAAAGAAGVMSLQEALERYKAGDTSEAVLKTIQAGSAAAMLTPPLGKNLSRIRKAGGLGAVGSFGYELGRRLLKDEQPEE